MLKTLQIATLVALGVVVAEVAWIAHFADDQWGFVFSVIAGYVGILSLVLYGNPERLAHRSFQRVFLATLGTVRASTVTLGVVLLCSAALAILCYRIAIKVTENYFVEVYEGNRSNGVEAHVTIVNRFSGEIHAQRTGPDGVVGFEVEDEGVWEIEVSIEGNDGRRFASLPVDVLKASQLPKIIQVDLRSIASTQWQLVASAATSINQNRVLFTAPPESPIKVLGNTTLADNHLPWGMPSAETLIHRETYSAGFDPNTRLARWAAYGLTRAQFNPAPSNPRWRVRWQPDPLLAEDVQSSLQDYRNSGYHKGNLVPKSFNWGAGEEAHDSTLFFSVVAPQTPMLNNLAWFLVEQYAQEAALAFGDVWVMAGPIFEPVDLGDVRTGNIFIGETPVPTHFFYVIARADAQSGIAVLPFFLPNQLSFQSPEATQFLVSVDEIEARTKLDLFDLLPGVAQDVIESQVPASTWNF